MPKPRNSQKPKIIYAGRAMYVRRDDAYTNELRKSLKTGKDVATLTVKRLKKRADRAKPPVPVQAQG